MQLLWKDHYILTPVFVQIDKYVSLHQNGPSNYTLDWSLTFLKIQATATRPITRGLGLQPRSGLFSVRSSSVCGLFAVLGPDF